MDNSLHIRRFAFSRVFDVPAADAPAVPAEELHRRIAALQADLTLARHDREAIAAGAHARGYEEGVEEVRRHHEAALLAAVDALHATVEGVEARLGEIAEDHARIAAETACAAAEFLAARALEDAPGAAIDAAIGRVLAQVSRGQEIQVSVAPELVADIERLIAVRQAADRRRLALTVVPDPAIASGDAHIHWDRGGVILDFAQRLAAVREALGGAATGE